MLVRAKKKELAACPLTHAEREKLQKEVLETNSWSLAFRLPEGDSIKGRPIHLTLNVRRYPSTGKLNTWSGWISMEHYWQLLETLEKGFQLSPTEETDPNG